MILVVVFLQFALLSLVDSHPYINDSPDCVADWGKCGGTNWQNATNCCNAHYFCNYQDASYSECIPKPLVPFPPAPASQWCGDDGTTLNNDMLLVAGQVNSLEIAYIWSTATDGLNESAADGGMSTCVQAVTVAIGECGHAAGSNWMTVNDSVCSFEASGAGGIWQVTSADGDDTLLAGCDNGYDPCCNARMAYAHSYNQGGATIVPDNYCEFENDCNQIYTKNNEKWNNVEIDLATKPSAKIPFCSLNSNPWYTENQVKEYLTSVTIDQSPCYFGPFSIAAGGVGREFFAGFYGWGGWFQHYTDSKAGECDPSPQAQTFCNASDSQWGKYPSYSELAVDACNAMIKQMRQRKKVTLSLH